MILACGGAGLCLELSTLKQNVDHDVSTICGREPDVADTTTS
jgi:hypothetical protein